MLLLKLRSTSRSAESQKWRIGTLLEIRMKFQKPVLQFQRNWRISSSWLSSTSGKLICCLGKNAQMIKKSNMMLNLQVLCLILKTCRAWTMLTPFWKSWNLLLYLVFGPVWIKSKSLYHTCWRFWPSILSMQKKLWKTLKWQRIYCMHPQMILKWKFSGKWNNN